MMGFRTNVRLSSGLKASTAHRVSVAIVARGVALPKRHSTHAKIEGILQQAAAVFCQRGYHQASMRDIARATGVSLAGLYYYFSSKEHLLYRIQRHAFETLLSQARVGLASAPSDPEERLRIFIRLHVKYFLDHPNEMKVLTHEERSIEDKLWREVGDVKKAYYQLCFDEVEALKRVRGLPGLDTRVAALSLFGMMNWIYTWYNPRIDPGAQELAHQMTEIFLHGVSPTWARGETKGATVHTSGHRSSARHEELTSVTE